MDITIGITTWNQAGLVAACLDSIFRHPPAAYAFEVIVVDNASADGTAEMIAARFPRARLFHSPKNLGWTGGCNYVARNARGRYVVLLNEDTTVEEDAFGALAAAMDAAPGAGIGAPKLVWPDGERQPSCRRFPDATSLLLRGTGLGRRFARGKLARYLGDGVDLRAPSAVDWALGACLMIRREVFDRVGLLDERYHYHDDTDFCYRARLAGYRTVFFPAITVVHHYQRRSAKSWLSRSRWRHVRSIARLFCQHGLFLDRNVRRLAPDADRSAYAS